jgi:plasmid stabilization system protein ParE
MAFRVEPTAQAQRDLDLILQWLLDQGAGEAGLRWFFKLETPYRPLPIFPSVTRSPRRARSSLLRCVSSFTGAKPHQYRVMYTIDGDTVAVLHIRHGRRRHIGESH